MSSPHARATIGHATANVTVNTVADGVYLAGDFSGIQRFVLRVKSAGKAQAKRLRARSFLLELVERAALWHVEQRCHTSDDDVLIRGGGGFWCVCERTPTGRSLSDSRLISSACCGRSSAASFSLRSAGRQHRQMPARRWNAASVNPAVRYFSRVDRGTWNV